MGDSHPEKARSLSLLACPGLERQGNILMRRDLDHLPANKQRELGRVVQLVFEEFEAVTACASKARKKAGRVLKVILYGSYARSGWVDEPHTAKGYKSDFDLLIIVDHKDLTDRVKYWSRLDERLMREYGITGTLKTPVNLIVHTLGEVNDGLALYEADDTELHTPKPKMPERALGMSKEYFEEWMSLASSAQKGFLFFMSQHEMRDAAFILHQAAERLYHSVLLVVTFYTPHFHNLAFLRTQAERVDRRLAYVWPSVNRRQRAMFEKLKEAYVKARYSKHYQITNEELTWLGQQIEELGRVVHLVCNERIAALDDLAGTRTATRAGQ